MVELSALIQARTSLPWTPWPSLNDTPLCLHAAYRACELLATVGWLTAARKAPFQAGMPPLTSRKTELPFVTLDKREGDHDRISYRDYAVSTGRLQWPTQNSAGDNTPGGRRYLDSPGNGWQFHLFLRPRKGAACRARSLVVLETVDGDRPMSMVWRLATPLPSRMFR